jgi:DHA2 family multidrug resistance protein
VRYFTAATVVSAVLLVIHELRFADPVIDLRIFKVFGYTLAVVLLSFQSAGLFSITLLNPMFVETVLGYDALRAGIAVAPRGVGVIVALLIVGRVSRRGIDTRPLVCAGFILGAYEVWRMSQWNFSVSESGVMWTICLFGLGLGAVFPTLSAVSIGQLPRERMGNAASLFSMLTNIGAATGIAVVTNLLTSRQRLYQGRFMDSFSMLDAWKKMYTLPGTDGAALPHHFLNGAITNQAWLYAYRDVYLAIAVLTLLLAPWCMLLNRPTSGRPRTGIG